MINSKGTLDRDTIALLLASARQSIRRGTPEDFFRAGSHISNAYHVGTSDEHTRAQRSWIISKLVQSIKHA